MFGAVGGSTVGIVGLAMGVGEGMYEYEKDVGARLWHSKL
jgi:hypothetical protein